MSAISLGWLSYMCFYVENGRKEYQNSLSFAERRKYKKSRKRGREKNPVSVISLVGINQKRKRNVISVALRFLFKLNYGFG